MTGGLTRMHYCGKTGKIVHRTRNDARSTMYGMQSKKRKRPTDNLNVFRCDACGGYHVGNRVRKDEK